MKFSIIVPVYNVEKYIDECLSSIYKLELSDKEVVIVNDGSTDNSYEIIEKYKNKFPKNTKVVSQVNQGLSEARNTGIRNSTGEYIIFIDSDDFINPEATEKILEVAYLHKTDIMIGDYLEYYSNEEIKKRKHYNLDSSFEKNGMFFIEEGFKNKCLEVIVWKNIYRREFLLKYDLFFEKGLLHEDNLFTPKAFYFAQKVRYFKGTEFYYYRKTNLSSIMNNRNKKNYQHLFFITKELLNFRERENINNPYFNRFILGNYLEVVLNTKYKNREIFNKISSLKFNLREKIKLVITLLKSISHKELKGEK